MGFAARQLLLISIAVFLAFNFSTLGLADDGTVEVPSDLTDFFASFDGNGNGQLDTDEANEFFKWVERNVEYRYDDENYPDPKWNYAVGDGRAGTDYMQTPLETFLELAGDCEDMAKLQTAFYEYWGYETGIGVVKLDNGGYHAFALVRIEEMPKGIGKVSYYDIDEYDAKYYKMEPGRYMVVDNAYTNRLGRLSSRISDTSLLYTLA